MLSKSIIYLVPSVLSENATETIPAYIVTTIKDCQVIFAENDRTTRRFLKRLWPQIVIDDYEWVVIHKAEEEQVGIFKQKIKEGKNIVLISEAGCPGVADPGQVLVHTAHDMNITVRPLVGPSAVLLALMASGLNGQHFRFSGYLPIEPHDRLARIKQLEEESARQKCTQIFIETPYRNNAVIEAVLKTCKPGTKFCIAAELTSGQEFIKTKTIENWRKQTPDLHKKQVIFLLMA